MTLQHAEWLLMGTAVGGAYALFRVDKRLKFALVAYGDPSTETSADVKIAVQRQFALQQNIAFGLLVLAILVGLAFSSLVIWRVVTAQTLSWGDLARCVGVAADVWIGRYAQNLYRAATRELQKVAA
jgi:hypothetical protein